VCGCQPWRSSNPGFGEPCPVSCIPTCFFLLHGEPWPGRDAGEEHLRHSGVPYTIIRPGWITGTPAGQSTLVAEQGDRATRGGSTSCHDLAAVCCAALTDPAARNVTLELFSRPQKRGGYSEAPLAEQLQGIFQGLAPDAHPGR
jgi:hypothetical protein